MKDETGRDNSRHGNLNEGSGARNTTPSSGDMHFRGDGARDSQSRPPHSPKK